MTNFLALLFAPLAALLFLPLKAKFRSLFYAISTIISGVSIGCALRVDTNLKIQWDVIGFKLIVDPYSKIFLVLISCTWLISIIYSFEFTKYHFQKRRVKFFLYLNSLLFVACISACAGNLVTLFAAYFIGIPLTYPLITIRENTAALQSGKHFLKQTAWPAIFIFLPAIFITNYAIGHTSFDGNTTLGSENVNPLLGGILLTLFVVGISKNSVFPFHTWLSKTSPAPAPVSGLIHSVATVKTGSIALIKIAVYIFGLDYIHQLTSGFLTGGWLIYLCGGTAVYTAYRALTTDDLKQRFAFSTVGQLSYILLAVMIGTKLGVLAATLHIVTHAIAKSCLFYVAGFYNSIYHTVSIAKIGKIMPHTRFVALVIAICGLSITGFPFLAGYHSKDLMLIEEWHSHYYASAIFLVIGSLVNILYIVGPVQNAFRKKDPELVPAPVPRSMLLTFIISIILIVTSNFYVPYITALLE
ncbi:proton-conducting transporter transmembrane domain-containing protein [Ohtaekwangia sp.]|uniref:proton-conducting transporter transmembrane domain-containing protein n=1 Tax=Ohtaekwangia sp. TaxID=2066019 RepID=UPI002FDDEC83